MLFYFVIIFSASPAYIKIVTPVPLTFLGEPNAIIVPIYSQNLMDTNKFVSERYNNEIYPQGKTIISNELLYISQLKDDESKLDEIFRWEMKNWHNPDWENGYKYTNNENPFFLNNDSFYSPNLKLLPKREFQYSFYVQKNPNETYYGDDPYWLAYNKIGACRELSTLFSFMANNAGIKSRTVQAGFWHQWTEVKINGEWMYYDPWCAGAHHYYDSNNGNLTFKDKWFNKIEYFEDNCQSYAYVNFYNDVMPNPLATQTYTISYLIHNLKKSINIG